MKKALRLLVAAVAVAFLASAAFAAAPINAFTVKDASGKEFKSDALKGKTTVLVLTQSACSQCRNEMKDLADYKDKIAAKANLFAVVVDLDSARAVEYFKSKGFDFNMLLDPDFNVGGAVGAGSTPATIVIDKDLNVKYMKTGYKDGDLEKLMKELN